MTKAEGFGIDELFKIMDDFERQTRPLLQRALMSLKEDKGKFALKPWNRRYALMGATEKKAGRCGNGPKALPDRVFNTESRP